MLTRTYAVTVFSKRPDIQTSSDSSEYLHHSRAREVTNTSKLSYCIANWGYDLKFSLPCYFPFHYDSIQCHWLLCHSNLSPVGTKTVLRKTCRFQGNEVVLIPFWEKLIPHLLYKAEIWDGRCQASRCFAWQWKAVSAVSWLGHVQSIDTPLVLD